MAFEPTEEDIQGFLQRNSSPQEESIVDANKPFEPTEDDINAFIDRRKFDSPVEAGLLGAARTLSFGTSDYGLTRAGIYSPEDLRKYEEFNPTATNVGEFGSLGVALLPTAGFGLFGAAARAGGLGIKAASRAGSVVERAISRQFAREAAKSSSRKILEKATATGVGTAIEGGFYGAGQVVSEYSLGNPELTAESALSTVGLSSILSGGAGGLLSLTGSAIKGLAKSTPGLAKKAYSKIRGIDEETIDVISKRGDEIAEFEALGKNFDDASDVYAAKTGEKINARDAEKVTESLNRIDELFSLDDKYILKKEVPLNKILPELDKIKAKIAPEGIQIGGNVKSALRKIEDLRQDIIDVAKANVSKKGSETVINSFLKQIPASSGKSVRGVKFLKEKYGFGDSITEALRKRLESIGFRGDANLAAGLNKIGRNMRAGLSTKEAFEKTIQEATAIRQLNRAQKTLDKSFSDLEAVVTDTGRGYVNRIPVDLVSKDASLKNAFITPKQINIIRRQVNEEAKAAYNKIAGGNKPASEAFADVANFTRDLLDQYVSPEIRKINKELARVIQARQQLSRYGLKEYEVDSRNLKRLFESTDKAFAGKDKKAVQELDELLGLDLMARRELVNAAKQLNTKSQLFKFPTGMSTLIPGLGFAGGLPFGTIPAAIAAGAGAVLQSPMMTRPIIQGATALGRSGIGPAISDAAEMGLRAIPDELAPFIAAQMAVLSRLESDKQRMESKIQSSVSNILKGKPVDGNYILKKSGLINFGNKSKNRQQNYQKVLDDIAEMVSNPQKLQAKVTENLRQLGLVAPETTGIMQQKAIDAAFYIYDQAPKSSKSTPLSMRKQDSFIPSDTQLDKFDDVLRTIEQPLSVLKDLSDKRLSPVSVEVLKKFYPDIYGKIVEEIVVQAQKENIDINYQQRLAISQFVGMKLEEALKPGLFKRLQAGFQENEDGLEKPIDIKLPDTRTSTQRVIDR